MGKLAVLLAFFAFKGDTPRLLQKVFGARKVGRNAIEVDIAWRSRQGIRVELCKGLPLKDAIIYPITTQNAR